jgi:predicted membrane chloride channel (bestrophin family)
MVTLAVVLLRIAGSTFRRRHHGVRMLAIYSLPIGILVGGALIQTIGFHATATLYAVTGIALTLLVAWRRNADLWCSADRQ